MKPKYSSPFSQELATGSYLEQSSEPNDVFVRFDIIDFLLHETKNNLPWRIARMQQKKHLSLSKNKRSEKSRHSVELIIMKCYQCEGTRYRDVTCHIGGGGWTAPCCYLRITAACSVRGGGLLNDLYYNSSTRLNQSVAFEFVSKD
jgi:hypothetical protein